MMVQGLNNYNYYNQYRFDLTHNVNNDQQDVTENTSDNSQTTDNSETVDELLSVNKEVKASYQISFEERAQIQQSMQLQSMITQFNISNSSSDDEDNSYTSVSNDILKGEQVTNQLGVINSSVSSTTEEKNEYISDRVKGTDSYHKENEVVDEETTTDETTDIDSNKDGYVDFEVYQ